MNYIVKNTYNFNKLLFNLNNKSHFILKIFKNFWLSYNIIRNNIIILEVLNKSSKKDIKIALELIFNIKVISVNTLIKKKFNFKKKNFFNFKKKAFIKFFLL